MPKRNLDAVILGLDDKPLKAGETDLILKDVCLQACLAVMQSDQGVPQAKKLELWKLSLRLNKGGVQEFTSAELATMNERIALFWNTLVMGRAHDLLETDYQEAQ